MIVAALQTVDLFPFGLAQDQVDTVEMTEEVASQAEWMSLDLVEDQYGAYCSLS